MKIAILNYPYVVSSSVTGPIDMFLTTNNSIKQMYRDSGTDAFEIDIITVIDPCSANPSIPSIILPDNIKIRKVNPNLFYDLIVIPAMHFDYIENVLSTEKELITWIKEQYSKGSEIASICLGTFFLGADGIIQNKIATTHWLASGIFREKFPDVKLLDDKIITDQDGIYTSGGAFSFTALIIYLIEKYTSKEIASFVSKVMMVHLHNVPQSANAIFNMQHSHQDKAIREIQKEIEERSEEKISVVEIANRAGMSMRTFLRRFRKATGNTPLEYIQRTKVERAKHLLVQTNPGVEQVGYQIGYDDISAFRKVFKKHTGMTPTDYRKRYSRLIKPELVGTVNS